jgi:hypothetical protein
MSQVLPILPEILMYGLLLSFLIAVDSRLAFGKALKFDRLGLVLDVCRWTLYRDDKN